MRVIILVAVCVAVFGFDLFAIIGAVILASLWNFFSGATSAHGQRAARRQAVFFDGIFSLLGYIAKADGVVCKDEISFADALMRQMQLTDARREYARELFRRGKRADFDIDQTLQQVRTECGGSIEMFMRILVGGAAIDGNIGDAERRILHYVGRGLGFDETEVQQIEAAVCGGYRNRSYGGDDSPDMLGESYKILGLQSNASDADIKRSYRRLMSRHHPDKLAAKGMPPEMMRAATERAQEISGAYERVKKARGM